MPGGRLTHQDRQHIAAGLAEGLEYAEIARQLGRPTSTVSREVARNGGPDGYRADHAHQATGHRARRQKPASPSEPTVLDADGRDPEAVRDYVEQFAAMMVEAGLPRMAAHVLACLYTTESGSVTAAELVQRLRVSPASVSKAIGYLAGLDVVRRERDSRRRRERYVVDDDMWLNSWLTSARVHIVWADTAARGAELFAATPAGDRLARMSLFFARLGDDMAGGPAEATVGDALTVLAALAHAGVPLTVERLALALGWPQKRVTDALEVAEQRPDVTDPVTLGRGGPGTYTIAAAPGRLGTAQREALGHQRQDRVSEPVTG